MTRRPPAPAGYPDARPIRDGLRLYVWTLRGYAHGAARRKSGVGVRLFSGWMFIIGVLLFPLLIVTTPAGIALRRSTRYYMTPDAPATMCRWERTSAIRTYRRRELPRGAQARAAAQALAPIEFEDLY